MPTFEQGFADAEKAADSVLNALKALSGEAKRMQKAAQDGNIAAVRRHTERLQDSLTLIRQEVSNATNAWPFTPDEEQGYLEDQYAQELVEEAGKKHLQIHDRDGRLIAHPSIVRVMPGDRVVQINRKKTSAIRPTKVVRDLQALQTRRSPFRPQQFLASLHIAYGYLTGVRGSDTMKLSGVGQVVPLSRIYDLFTGLPGAKRDYSQIDFARDLYRLEESGVREVSSGEKVHFPSSARSQGTISFVGPEGEPVIYYGIQFTGDSR